MNKKNNSDLVSLINLTETINKIYKKLRYFELNYEKNTHEYKKNLRNLKLLLEIEEEKYDALSNDECKLFINYLSSSVLSEKDKFFFENLFLGDNSHLEVKRIIFHLTNKIYLDPKSDVLEIKIDSKYKNQFNLKDIDKMREDACNQMNIYNELTHFFHKENFSSLLYFLSKYINDARYSNYYEELVKIKYELLFVMSFMDSGLIDNKYDVLNSSIFNSKVLASAIGISNEEYTFRKNEYFNGMIDYTMDSILEMDDSKFEVQKNCLTVLIKTIYMESCFSFFDEEYISEKNYQFHEVIEDRNWILDHKGHFKSIYQIASVFTKLKKSQKIIKLKNF